MVDFGPSAARLHGFAALASERPAGDLVAYARPAAGQAAIRGDAASADFMAKAKAALGTALPTDSRSAGGDDALIILRLGPDNWLAIHEDEAGFGIQMEQAVGFHAINVSSTRSRLRLEGEAARDLLSTGCRIDLRESAFPPGAFAQAPVGSATTIIHCRDAATFDLYIARSFAESWLVWLRHAGQEFGLVTV